MRDPCLPAGVHLAFSPLIMARFSRCSRPPACPRFASARVLSFYLAQSLYPTLLCLPALHTLPLLPAAPLQPRTGFY